VGKGEKAMKNPIMKKEGGGKEFKALLG